MKIAILGTGSVGSTLSVLLIDHRDGRILQRLEGGQQTTGLAISPDGWRLAFTDFQDDRVRLFELELIAAPVLEAGH